MRTVWATATDIVKPVEVGADCGRRGLHMNFICNPMCLWVSHMWVLGWHDRGWGGLGVDMGDGTWYIECPRHELTRLGEIMRVVQKKLWTPMGPLSSHWSPYRECFFISNFNKYYYRASSN